MFKNFRLRFILAGLALLYMGHSAVGVFAREAGEPEVIAERFTLKSDILGEERKFWVSLPAGYDDALYAPVRYPVIYILDGAGYYPLASSAVKVMSGVQNIPESILVAIDTRKHRTRDLTPYHSLAGWQDRARPDLATSGGGAKFLAFVKDELIPHIDATYRTAPHRTVVGHSLGGLTTANSFLTQPGLFQGYVSIDGSLWWDKLGMITRAQAIADRKDLKGRFYFSLADHETTGPGDLTNMVVGNMKFVDILDKAPSPALHVTLEWFKDETHGSVGLPSLYYGLRYVFEGHRLSHAWAADAKTLVRHFQKISENLGFDYLPPERFVDTQAYQEAGFPREDEQAILAFLRLNVANYPASSHAHSRLADYHKKRDNRKKAQMLYRKALKLNPDNRAARKALETLGKE